MGFSQPCKHVNYFQINTRTGILCGQYNENELGVTSSILNSAHSSFIFKP